MNKPYWKNGINEIIKTVLNGKRTIQEAKFYMLKNYIYDGNSRKAFNHVAYETTPADTVAEATFYNYLQDAIKLGYGKDKDFNRVFR